MFKLDKRLESDTILVKELKSFQVRLMNANEFFWMVLIPNKPNLIEFWQNMPSRLHDRTEYKRINKQWKSRKLFP